MNSNLMHETPDEFRTRRAEGFPDSERDLPKHVGSRFNIPLADNLSSYLGELNPIAREVDPATEVVWLLDNTAYRPVHRYPHKPQPWQAEFVAAYFKKDSGKDLSVWVADIANKLGLGQKGENIEDVKATIAARLVPFAQDVRPARFVNVSFPNRDVEKLGPGGRNAISSQTVGTMGDHRDGDTVAVNTVPPELAPNGSMNIYFAEPEGWAVISGINSQLHSPPILSTHIHH